MSNRNDRRAAEREARKLAYKELRQQRAQSSDIRASAEANPISEAQLNANRANAQFSSGPVTEAGKARSSRNALKHGLTGKTVLLPHEDATEYQRQLDIYAEIYRPANDDELTLVQSMLDCAWRLNRVQRLETAVLLKGNLEFESKYADRSPLERAHLIEAEAYIKYEKQIRNLNIQEARLRRVMEKDKAELLRLQAIRKRQEALAPQQEPIADANPNGFEFSMPPNDPALTPDYAEQYQEQAA